MRRFALALALILGSQAAAEEGWVPLNGEQIAEALTDRKLRYSNAWQEFYGSGRTNYNAGRPSWGYWEVREDQYCSTWPPSDDWECYDIARSGETIRFTGKSGDITDGVYDG